MSNLAVIVKKPEIQARFSEVLGDKKESFVSSLITVSNQTGLKKCEPMSVISAAMIAASLDLPINPSLGFNYIIPYGSKATYQIGYKGLIQLALRSGKYERIHACVVYDGDLISYNRFSDEMVFKDGPAESDKIIGFFAMIKTVNGFRKNIYWTVEEVKKHANKFSQTYRNGRGVWKDNFEAMGIKTVLKQLLSKYGILSIEMQSAIEADQTADGEYIDNVEVVGQESAKQLFENTIEIDNKVSDLQTTESPAKVVEKDLGISDVSEDETKGVLFQ